MTTNQSDFQEETLLVEGISKREQKKISQAIKIIDAQEKINPKNPKRKANTLLISEENPRRKLLKTQSVCSDDKSKSMTESNHDFSKTVQKSELFSKSKADENETNSKKIYNTKYKILDGQDNIFNYLLNYSCGQKQKIYEKQGEQWNHLDCIGKNSLKQINNTKENQNIQIIHQKFEQIKEKLYGMYSRNYMDFIKNNITKQL